jgi:hypothetical protein
MIDSVDKNITLTSLQERRLFDTVETIISKLPTKAIDELMTGYMGDIDALIHSMMMSAEKAMFIGKTIDSESLDYLDNLKASMDLQLKKMSFNYFCTTVLSNFRMNWRNLEQGSLMQLYPWSSYLASRGSGKCLEPGTYVVMADGSTKMIQDIKVGDKVMGIDSTPRTVLELHHGTAPMYKVKQSYAMDYVVNEGHLICARYLRRVEVSKKPHKSYSETIYKEIPVQDIPKHPGYSQKKISGYRVEGWDLPEKELPLEPYFLGIWLGDGHSYNSCISKPDIEIYEYLCEYAERLGLSVASYRNGCYKKGSLRSQIYDPKIPRYRGRGKKSDTMLPLTKILKDMGLFNNKHIPDIYMRASRQQRLELLAGLLDTDGCCEADRAKRLGLPKTGRSFEYSSKDEKLAYQVQQLAWSLGFRCKTVKRECKNIKVKSEKRGEYILKDYVFYRMSISGKLHNLPTRIKRKQVQYVEQVQDPQVSSLTVHPVGEGEYYGFACDGDHKFLLADGTVVHNSYQYCYAFPLWRLYGYDVPHSWDDPRYMVFNNNYKETSLISSSIQLCKAHMTKIINEIDNNEIIKEKLNPNNRAKIGEMGVQTETGAIIHIRGASSAIRGLHTGACVVDDMPDESSLYSEEARQKLKELIKGTIEPTVEPFGYFIISGTPFSNAESDLYKVIKSDKRFKCFEYPIIFPDGRPLAPDRYTFEDLMRKKEELGTTVFAREYLVIPIDDSSSIFPYDILKRTTIGMENVDYATTVDNFPIKMTRVVIGVDFAISGNIGADFTVYSVVGMDAMKNYYLIYYERLKGASHNEQVDKIVVLDQMFRPNKVVCESNGFQSILAGLARERGLMNIDTFTTTEGNKKDLHNGWASLAALFERGQFKVPYKAGTTKEKTDYLFSEFSSITFRSDKGKLEAGSGHDDCVSSIFIAYQSLKEGKGSEPVVTML